jgi:cob(I)alamin adenosyltransferase
MLYTGKGDDGKTNKFDCDQRFSKSSKVAEALGALDELNSFLGLVKLKSVTVGWKIMRKKIATIVVFCQDCLFTVQAEVAGARKTIRKKNVKEMENIINATEKEMPPIRFFSVSGGTELSALLDFSRTLARKAERRVVDGFDSGEVLVSDATLAFLNRLSSLLYALARLVNHKSGINEVPPSYA